ncbi:MAG: hypothetical protein IPK16_08370 [Anaerolineales bacterium]|nr:hypothetical protein [Anaerolineales bacterium]
MLTPCAASFDDTVAMNTARRFARLRQPRWIASLVVAVLFLLLPMNALAQGAAPAVASTPMVWYLIAGAIAMLVPVGLVLMGVAGLAPERAWNAALGGLGALALAGVVYWAIGFALQFGGVGLTYTRPELRALVWEWSPLPADWGTGWGAAGLNGWFMGGDMTALAYALFFTHLPWVFTVALLPVLALRGRAPAMATLLLALLMGGIIYPLAGNWVQGGGWLSALGRNLVLGHGFVDAGGAGVVFLLAGAFTLAALAVWAPRRGRMAGDDALPPTYQPLLAVAGGLFVLAGAVGWLWSNPLQVEVLSELALMRGSVNIALAAVGGVITPLLYTWFVTGNSDPSMSARGLAGGVIAGMAAAPFVQPGQALLVGVVAGATVPFMTFVYDRMLNLDDATGVLTATIVPATIGLLAVGFFADGAAGAGWQATSLASHLGVAGQGVTGLFAAQGFQRDFPGQLQAQLAGILAIGLWGFLSGLIVCIPLALLFFGLHRSAEPIPDAPLPAEVDISRSVDQPAQPFR